MARTSAPLMLALLVGCTEAQLERPPDPPPPPIDNFMALSGRFCTEDPLSVEFPVKILFVVDISDSMSVTDPPDPADNNYTGRTRAVIDVINNLAGIRGVEIAIIGFHSAILDFTQGFKPIYTASQAASLIGSAQRLNSEQGQTNYEGALESAFEALLADIASSDDILRARSKYSVIFVSDGLPQPVDPPTNTPESIYDLVNDIQKLQRERRLQELRVHSVYMSGRTPPMFQQQPLNLLRGMSEVGRGTFRNIGNGEKINFLDLGFTSFRRVFALKSFVTVNMNARPVLDIQASTDSDGDGLSDAEEDLIGSDPSLHDTDGDGFNDFLEDRLRNGGFNPLDPVDADCRLYPNDDYNRRDDDGDGLLNCEERFLGSNPRLFDTDADGLADPLEILARLSPTDDEYFGDIDRDGVASGFELRDHTDPGLDDSKDFFPLRYRYDLEQVEIKDSRTCYTFKVDNIRLVSAMPSEDREAGRNEIHVVFGEAPADIPGDYGDFRVACVRPRFDLAENTKSPANGRIVIPEDAFKIPANLSDRSDPTVFNAERDCITPP